jgi:hypothetical protein
MRLTVEENAGPITLVRVKYPMSILHNDIIQMINTMLREYVTDVSEAKK